MKGFFKRVMPVLCGISVVFCNSTNAAFEIKWEGISDILDLKTKICKIKTKSDYISHDYGFLCLIEKCIDCIITNKLVYESDFKLMESVKLYIEGLCKCNYTKSDLESSIEKYISDKTDLDLYKLGALAGEFQPENKLYAVYRNFKLNTKTSEGDPVNFSMFNAKLLELIHTKLYKHVQIEGTSAVFRGLSYDLEHLNFLFKEQYVGELLSGEERKNILIFEKFNFPTLFATSDKRLKPLQEYVTEQNLKDTTQALNLAIQLFNGLNVLHSKGIFHGNLSPDNVLVDENGILKICNFGSSVILKPITSNLIDSRISMAIVDIRCAQNIVNQFLLTNDSKVFKKYKRIIGSKPKSSSKMIWSAKAHLEALRSLKI